MRESEDQRQAKATKDFENETTELCAKADELLKNPDSSNLLLFKKLIADMDSMIEKEWSIRVESIYRHIIHEQVIKLEEAREKLLCVYKKITNKTKDRRKATWALER